MFDSKILKKSIKNTMLFVGFVSIPLFAQTSEQIARFEERSYTSTSNSITIPYRLFVPDNYNQANSYPLVTCLHGNGERGTDNVRQFMFNVAKRWIEDSVQARVPNFIFAPHSAVGWADAAQQDVVMEIIQSLKQEFSLDTTRLYLAGLSAGAMGVWDIMRDYPTMFAAAVPCAGIAPIDGAAAIARTPFWSFIGTKDMVIETVRNFIQAVEDLGNPVVRFVSLPNLVDPTAISYDSLTNAVYGGADYLYSEVTGGEHNTGSAWNEAWSHPLLTIWLFSKTKPQQQTPVTASLPHNGALSSPTIIRVSGSTSIRIPPSWQKIADAVAFYTVSGRRLGRACITDNTILDIRSMGYGTGILFVKADTDR